MQDVGESADRNREFERKFNRELLIRSLIPAHVTEPLLMDVGGHHGESVRFLRAQFPGGVIHSFEPSPEAFARLRSLADAQTHCHNLAIGDVDGAVTLYVNSISHTNSVFRVNPSSSDSVFFEQRRRSNAAVPAGMFNRPLQVQSVQLASFCRQHGIGHIDLLKLDVQGAERREGARQLLQVTANIILEIMFFDYYEHQSSFLEIESLLHPAGFRLFSISEISNNPMNGRTDWAEVIYRRAPPP